MSGTRRAGSGKRAARARLAAHAATISNTIPPTVCPECAKKTEELRVAHVTIKYLQRQMVEMASKIVPPPKKRWPQDYDLPG